MNLRTPHGRAQAIADGGQAGELARIIEDALAAHSSEREALCWEQLNSINTFHAEFFVEAVDELAARLTEDDKPGKVLARETLKRLHELEQTMLDVARMVREAMEILDSK